MVDMVISVVADKETRTNRLMKDRSLTRLQVRDRMRTQENLERFWKTADVVIDNSSNHKVLGEAVDQLLLINNL